MTINLFDKVVNLRFFRSDAPSAQTGTEASIVCPESGRKPTIRVSGEMVSQDVIQQVEVRVTNFVSDLPLNQYRSVEIEAGYRGSLSARMQGQVINSYQEKPGPDSVTVFQVTVGRFDDWVSKTLTSTYPGGTPLATVCSDVASKLGLTLQFYAPTDLRLPVGISHNGLAKELVVKLRRLFASYDPKGNFTGIEVRPDGANLIVFAAQNGTGVVHELGYVSQATRNAAGFDIQAPWVPSVRPGDTVKVDPKYFKQEVGAPGTALNETVSTSLFQVIYVSFQFCTTDDENVMTLKTVGADV